MRPTRIRNLLAVALLCGAAVWLVFRAMYGDLPRVPRTVALTTFVLAVAELFMAPAVRARLDGRPGTKPIMPIAVARTAAFAKASSAVGAVVVGCLAGAEAYVLGRSELSAARGDAVTGAIGLAAGLLLVVAALRLEYVCRVPPPPPPAEPGP